jgi:N-formylmaleamate deformylase
MSFVCQYVDVDGVRIHLRRIRCDGPPLLLIHGLTDNGACWSRVASHFAGQYDIVAVDLRAHGLSDAPPSGYGAPDFARDVIGVMEALDLWMTTIIGHSLGADTATHVALLRPDRVARLVLEDPPWSDDWSTRSEDDRIHLHQQWANGLELSKSRSADELVATARTNSPAWVEEELLAWAQSKQEVRFKALDCLLVDRPAWQLTVRGLRCPSLLITGETSRGALVSEAMADEARALSPELEVLHITGAGHCVHRDEFDAYLEGLRGFLERE